MAHGILIPQPGIEPMPPAVEAQSLNHWTARETSDHFRYFMWVELYSMTFCDWFISLSVMASKHFHVVACIRMSFLFQAK